MAVPPPMEADISYATKLVLLTLAIFVGLSLAALNIASKVRFLTMLSE
ncbi:MAG: hypothetical protein HYS06_08740 [Methylocystis sp.]|nr:hypothetical protein [Methylocystis sp.]